VLLHFLFRADGVFMGRCGVAEDAHEQLLLVFRQAPALRSDDGKVARELCLLLPASPSTRSQKRTRATIYAGLRT
jgi:hypothetical protein